MVSLSVRPSVKDVVYTAAHGGFSAQVPLGGGAAICRHLLQEWTATRPFQWRLLSPEILGTGAPQGNDLVRLSESDYARFCRRFESAVTKTIETMNPQTTVVLSNDVAEGPDFRRLAERGFSIYTIYHVDVIDYFVRLYFRFRCALRPSRAFTIDSHERSMFVGCRTLCAYYCKNKKTVFTVQKA